MASPRVIVALDSQMPSSSTLTFQGDIVKCSLPKDLYLAIAKIQVEQGIGWDEACTKSKELMNTGSEEFKKRVAEESRRLYDSQLMKQLNRARKRIRSNAYNNGFEAGKDSDHFSIPCHKCGKPMHFSDQDSNWNKSKAVLITAFSNWSHVDCD